MAERGSDKHGPRLDEDLHHHTSPLERGAPVEPRHENVQDVWGALGGTVEHRF
jgi:hypothetical protein